MGTEPVLEVKNLKTHFFTREGVVRAVDGVSFTVGRGEAVGIVGESGCGKSVTSLSIMRLVPYPGRIVEGQVILYRDGQALDLVRLSEDEMREIRGNVISMVFQDPMTSLNPVLTVGFQVAEPLQVHLGLSPAEARRRAVELLRRVGIPDAERRIDDYPHQFSGGMRQRVMVAMALACNPRLLIADEPTTALDVTIQAQILDLIARLNRELGTAVILITHDLGVVAELCHRVVVMYAGRIVEAADADSLFSDPKHPYTVGLMGSVPRLGPTVKERLRPIRGLPPNLLNPPAGCRFRPRCPHATAQCAEDPPVVRVGPDHEVACWLYA
jgi:oligopeptide transport system ATP-binding protein